MKKRTSMIVLSTGTVLIACTQLLTSGTNHTTTLRPSHPPPAMKTSLSPEPWLQFHHDAQHTGVSGASADFSGGAQRRWRFRLSDAPTTPTSYRWAAAMPLGDVDSDGNLEVVVTTPYASGIPQQIFVLKEDTSLTPGTGDVVGVKELWTQRVTLAGQADTYGSALVETNGDGNLDVVTADGSGKIMALNGLTGQKVWEYDMGIPMESGPVVADLDNDQQMEVILTAGNDSTNSGKLVVLSAVSTSGLNNTALWEMPFNCKTDSGLPTVIDLNPSDPTAPKALTVETWEGKLYVVGKTGNYRDPNTQSYSQTFDLRQFETPPSGARTVMRNTPTAFVTGNQTEVVFGWMPNYYQSTPLDGVPFARLAAVKISGNSRLGQATITADWSKQVDAWKSSPTLLPRLNDTPLIVGGYGNATYAACDPGAISGGIYSIDPLSQALRSLRFQNEGNIRSSAAVANLDGDSNLEFVVGIECFGGVQAFDGVTLQREWTYADLGTRTVGSPTIGDLNNDGSAEVVIASYDGYVTALQAHRAPSGSPVPAASHPAHPSPTPHP